MHMHAWIPIFAFLISFCMMVMVLAVGSHLWVEGISKIQSKLTFPYTDSGATHQLPVSNPWPAIPTLGPHHPSLQVHCKSYIRVLQTAWAVFPSYVLLCIYTFILLFLLKRTSFSRCHCDKCLPDVVQFSTTGSFLFAHRAPWTDSCF